MPADDEGTSAGRSGEAKAVAPDFSEEALALGFAHAQWGRFRHVEAWKQWMHYVDGAWRRDARLQAMNSVRARVRAAAADVLAGHGDGAANRARRLASAQTVNAVLNLARSDSRIATGADVWDRDPMLLATPGGVVDLASGSMNPSSPDLLITRLCRFAPAATGTKHPRWTRFLKDITGGDPAYIAYLRRLAGYFLTGLTQEHELYFLYGTGRNGKSVFLNTLANVMGDYAVAAGPDVFLEARGERHPTELAALRGARLVTAIEIDPGRSWRDSLVKQLTAGDPVTARGMRQDPFTFTPQLKIAMTGNHPPRPQRLDTAMKERIRILPFGYSIPRTRRDRTLQDKLLTEGPAILRWGIEGCLDFLRSGLRPPAAVSDAGQVFAGESDPLLRWIEERCRRDANAETPVSVLYASWQEWAGEHQEISGSLKMFSQNLASRGWKRCHGREANAFAGIGLKP